jgi:hypothetical protein
MTDAGSGDTAQVQAEALPVGARHHRRSCSQTAWFPARISWQWAEPPVLVQIKNPRSKLRGIGGRKEADQKNAASCGEYVPKEIKSIRYYSAYGTDIQFRDRIT